jgi:hypothetical protein
VLAPQQDGPVVELDEQRAGITEFFERRVHFACVLKFTRVSGFGAIRVTFRQAQDRP